MSWGKYELFSEKHSDLLINSLDKYVKDEEVDGGLKEGKEKELDGLDEEVEGMLATHHDEEDDDYYLS